MKLIFTAISNLVVVVLVVVFLDILINTILQAFAEAIYI